MRTSPRPQWSYLAPKQEDGQVASLWNFEALKERLVGNAFLIFHSFIEVSLTYNNLHIFKVYSLIRFNMYAPVKPLPQLRS